ncbi:MAG: hypothetical protein Kow0037_26480 [Calditrichia bacterium]
MSKNNKKTELNMEAAEAIYKKTVRIIEYYVLICFILITFVPLLNFGWVQGFTSFIYFTGFPLLLLLFFGSMVKEPILRLIANRISGK